MRKILFFLLFFTSLVSFAQISVESFEPDDYDMTAQDARVMDPNGEVCAVIKVETKYTGFTFDVGSLGVMKTVQKTGEIWVFVPRGVKKMTVSHQQLGVLRNYNPPVSIEGGRTYIMKLVHGTVEQTVREAVTQQYVLFKVTPKEDVTVMLNGEVLPVSDGTAQKRMPFGQYEYRIEAPYHRAEVGLIEVKDPRNKHVKEVTLTPAYGYLEIPATGELAGAKVFVDGKPVGTVPYKSGRMESDKKYQVRILKDMYSPITQAVTIEDGKTTKFSPTLDANFAEITLNVEENAEIWVNGEKKGVGTWTGKLSSGGYEVECRKANHRSTRKEIEVTPDMNGQSLSFDAPRPIMGSLDISSTPGDAEVAIDGQKVGTSPLFIERYIIGAHTVTFTRSGCKTETRTVTVEEGKTVEVKVELGKYGKVTFKANTVARMELDGKYVGNTPYTTEIASGKHAVKLTARGYKDFNQTVDVDVSKPEMTFRLQRQYFKPSGGYISLGFQAGQGMGFGAALGAYIHNVNIEGYFTKGLGKSDPVYWSDGLSVSVPTTYTWMGFGGKVGYGIPFAERFRVTPQVGFGVVSVKGEDVGEFKTGGAVKNLTFGVRAEVALAKWFSISLTPEYGLGFGKSDELQKVINVSSKVKGWCSGFNCRLGLNVNF